MKVIENQSPEKAEKLFQVCLETRNMEIDLFWKRSIFFWGFIAIAFAGYATLHKDNNLVAFPIACFGFTSSLIWILVNRGSKWWQQSWEERLLTYDKRITNSIFAEPKVNRKEVIFLGGKRYSVTKLTTLLSYYCTAIWTITIIHSLMSEYFQITYKQHESLFVNASSTSLTLIFSIIAIFCTKGKNYSDELASLNEEATKEEVNRVDS